MSGPRRIALSRVRRNRGNFEGKGNFISPSSNFAKFRSRYERERKRGGGERERRRTKRVARIVSPSTAEANGFDWFSGDCGRFHHRARVRSHAQEKHGANASRSVSVPRDLTIVSRQVVEHDRSFRGVHLAAMARGGGGDNTVDRAEKHIAAPCVHTHSPPRISPLIVTENSIPPSPLRVTRARRNRTEHESETTKTPTTRIFARDVVN